MWHGILAMAVPRLASKALNKATSTAHFICTWHCMPPEKMRSLQQRRRRSRRRETQKIERTPAACCYICNISRTNRRRSVKAVAQRGGEAARRRGSWLHAWRPVLAIRPRWQREESWQLSPPACTALHHIIKKAREMAMAKHITLREIYLRHSNIGRSEVCWRISVLSVISKGR